jgi:putative membrane protein
VLLQKRLKPNKSAISSGNWRSLRANPYAVTKVIDGAARKTSTPDSRQGIGSKGDRSMTSFPFGHQPFPYCGAPPSPETLLSRWNLDPILIIALIAVACLYAAGAYRSGVRVGKGRQVAFYIGWIVTALAVVSPLCPLSVSLFAARVGQHVILLFIGAPLVAIGEPLIVMRRLWAAPTAALTPRIEAASNAGLYIATGAFSVLMWFWHAPLPYAATFDSSIIYWAMHLSLYGTALWLWSLVLAPSTNRGLACIFAASITSFQMGFLGAVISFSPRPLYTPHALTTYAWGLTPLQDQQLGGAVLWVPGMIIFMAAAIIMLWFGIREAGPTSAELADH